VVEQAMAHQICTNFRDALQASQRRARTHLEVNCDVAA
jgi:hypothetical protein